MSKATDILQAYFYNQSVFMLHELEQLQDNVRYEICKKMSYLDQYHAAVAYLFSSKTFLKALATTDGGL